jgi:hypothetical protein
LILKMRFNAFAAAFKISTTPLTKKYNKLSSNPDSVLRPKVMRKEGCLKKQDAGWRF